MQYLWKACLVVMSALPGVHARGEVVIFDNRSGEFGWLVFCDCQQPGGTYLNVTHPPSQSGESNEFSFGRYYQAPVATPNWETYSITKPPELPAGVLHVVADDEPTTLIGDDVPPQDFYFVRRLGPGDIVDGGTNLMTNAFLSVENYYVTPPTIAIVDGPTFAGVSFIRNSQLHYGWILVDTVTYDTNHQPLLWAYETVPETPITIPDFACAGDVDGDTIVGIDDFLLLLAEWGTDPGGPPDFDGDGTVGIADFLALLANWGFCPLS